MGATLTWRGRELSSYSKNGKQISYSYDVDGMRYQKIVKNNGTETARYDYVYSDGKLILLTYTSNGTANTARFIYDSFGEPRGFILNNSSAYLYLKNGQGDITAIVDESGTVLLTYTYTAWGEITYGATSVQNMLLAATLSNVNPFTYRGYCYDYDIGMYYLQSRYYDPEICRFINADSTDYLGATGTLLSYNLFVYCENDPVDYVDENGCAKNHGKYNYFIVYSKKGSDFKRQAKWMAKYAYKNNKVKFIYVEKVTDFIKQWNSIPAERIINIHLFLHGQPGSLCFSDGELIYDSSLASNKNFYFSKLKNLKPTGKTYLYSCNGGTFYKIKSRYSSVAQVLSTRTNGKTVRAAVNDSVNYFRWYAPSSCKPILAYNEGYWADFNSKFVGKCLVSSFVSIGKDWYL